MWFRAVLIMALFSYLFGVHFAVTSGRSDWVVALLLLALLLFVFPRLRFLGRFWLSLFVVLGWVLLLAFPGDGWILVLFSMPSLIFALLAWLFARTLVGDRVPAVTRFARAMRESTNPRIEQYTRMATVAWSIFFVAMALQAAVFPLLVPPTVWAMFGTFVNFVLTLSMFAAEYVFRRIYLRAEPQYSVTEYLRRIRHIDLRKVMEP